MLVVRLLLLKDVDGSGQVLLQAVSALQRERAVQAVLGTAPNMEERDVLQHTRIKCNDVIMGSQLAVTDNTQ